jgi:hypothetical protein
VCGVLRALAAHLGGLDYSRAFALDDGPPSPPVPRIPERLTQYAQPVGLMPQDLIDFLDRQGAKARAKAAAEDVGP